MLHLEDSLKFWTEVTKSQPTSAEEAIVFQEQLDATKWGKKPFGRACIVGGVAPFVYACAKYKGYSWKFAGMYALFVTFNAFYDLGVYTRFFIYGPSYLRKMA